MKNKLNSKIKNIEFRFLKKREKNILTNFLRKNYHKKYYQLQRNFINWAYSSNYKNKFIGRDEISVFGAFKKDTKELYSILGFINLKCFIRKKESNLAASLQYENFSNIPGLGIRCFQKVNKFYHTVLINGLNQKYKKSLSRFYNVSKIIEEVPRKIAIINKIKCNKYLNINKKQKIKKFIYSNEISINKKEYYVTRNKKHFNDDYWKDHLERFPNTCDKRKKFITWRYLSHPYLKYFIIGTDKFFKKGIAVVRIEKVDYLNKHIKDISVLRILELLPKKNFEKDLNQAVLNFAKDTSCIMSDFFCSSKNADKICLHPFISFKKHKFMDIPYRLQPPDISISKSYNLFFNNNLKKNNKLQNLDFFTTKGDGEQDLNHVQSGLSKVLN